jgi:hypothetical protein
VIYITAFAVDQAVDQLINVHKQLLELPSRAAMNQIGSV